MSSALAAGAPANIGTPFESGQPAVAVDAFGNGVVAWANTKDLAGANDFVQYCVLGVVATGCAHSGNLTAAGNATNIDNVQVLVDGGTIVILADVYGASSGDYEPEQEWQSTDDGASFNIVNSGLSVADGILSADTEPLSAVIVPGTNELGYGWNTAGGPPTFNAFPLTSPPECSTVKCDGTVVPDGGPYPFAQLEPNTNPDTISNAGGQFAAQGGPSPGVMGIFNTEFTNGPLGCSNAQTVPFGTAFAYGSGLQSAANNYNISPGSPNSAWKVPAALADCNTDYPAVDGGPSGFGILEDNVLTGTTVYHRFDQATDSFDTAQVTVASEGEQEPSVSQDGSGGVYATYIAGPGGAIRLAYSFNGGLNWSGPATLDANTDGGAGDVTSNVALSGQGWAAWTDNGSIYAQSFIAADSIPPSAPVTVTTSQTAGVTVGSSLTVPVGTIGEVDKAFISGADASHASGSVSYKLYSKSSCPAAGQIFDGGTVTVSGGAVPASAPVTSALTPGKYYWEASYSGNPGSVFGNYGNDPGQSACGSEVLDIVPAAAIAASGSTNGKDVTVKVSCASVPCSIKVSLSTTEKIAVKASLASAAHKKRKKARTKTIALGSGRFKLRSKGSKKLKIGLGRAGKKYVRAHHGSFKAKLVVSEKIGRRTVLTTRTIRVKIVAAKHRHKK